MLNPESERRPETEDTIRKLPENESHPTLSGMVSDFSQETSLHGVKFIRNRCASTPRRLFWGFIVLGQLTAFVVVIVGQLQHVYTRPLLTKVITRYVRELPFPAVTVCSRIQNISHSSLNDFENDVVKNIRTANKTFFTSLTPQKYADIDLGQIYRKRHYGKSLVNICLFGTTPCMGLIGKVWSKEVEVGLCETVNSVNVDETLSNSSDTWQPSNQDSPSQLSPLVSVLPGTGAGLYLTMQLEDTDKTGVKIVLHDPNEKITLMNSEFLNLAPGTMNYVGVKVRQNKFLPAPYKAFGDRECVVTSAGFRHPLVPHGRYTLRACHDACLAKSWYEFCGCSLEIAGEMCDPIGVVDCSAKIMEAFKRNNLTDFYCDCPFPCEDIVFDTTLSSSPDLLHFPENERNNFVSVNIHFDRLRIDSMEQVEDYTNGDVFASVGGQLGLFLGASIITLVEIVELLIRCAGCWLPRRSNTVNSNNSDRKA